MTRPSNDCLARLELQKDNLRIQSLKLKFEHFLVEGTKQATELKAYKKILAEAVKNAQFDPNNQLWLCQLQEKQASHDGCQKSIESSIDQLVQQIDSHTRAETISIIKSLVSEGVFDPPPTKRFNTSSSSPFPTPPTTSIKTIEKCLENERSEREESFQSLERRFEDYRTFVAQRIETLESKLQDYTHSNDTRLKKQEETNRKEITSLKAAYQITKINHQKPPTINSNQAQVLLQNEQDQQRLKGLIDEHVLQHITRIKPQVEQLLRDSQALKTTVDEIQNQLGRLTKDTASVLKNFDPEIKRVTQAIQDQVIQTTKSVIMDGHQEMTLLMKETTQSLQEKVNHLEPAIKTSNEQIARLRSATNNLETQLSQTIQPKLIEFKSSIDKLEPILEKDAQNEVERTLQLNVCKGLQSQFSKFQSMTNVSLLDLTKSIETTESVIKSLKSQFKRFELQNNNLLTQVDNLEQAMNTLNQDRERPRSSTPPQPINYINRLSLTPPSPPPVQHEDPPEVPTLLSRTYPMGHNPPSKQETSQAKKARSASSSRPPSVPIAARLTDGPPPPKNQDNLISANDQCSTHQRREPFREPSVTSWKRNSSHRRPRSLSPQSAGSARGPVGSPAHDQAQAAESAAGKYNGRRPTPSYQPNRSCDSSTYIPHYGTRRSPRPVRCSLPLAKRLKSDSNPPSPNRRQLFENDRQSTFYGSSKPPRRNPYSYRRN